MPIFFHLFYPFSFYFYFPNLLTIGVGIIHLKWPNSMRILTVPIHAVLSSAIGFHGSYELFSLWSTFIQLLSYFISRYVLLFTYWSCRQLSLALCQELWSFDNFSLDNSSVGLYSYLSLTDIYLITLTFLATIIEWSYSVQLLVKSIMCLVIMLFICCWSVATSIFIRHIVTVAVKGMEVG